MRDKEHQCMICCFKENLNPPFQLCLKNIFENEKVIEHKIIDINNSSHLKSLNKIDTKHLHQDTSMNDDFRFDRVWR